MQQETSNISPIANCQSPIANGQCTESTRLPWLDFASGIMILWMIIYHALQTAWNYELNGLWNITDLSLLPEGVHAFINDEGRVEVYNPCVLFPWLHFFMPWFFYKSGQFFQKRSVKELWKKDSNKLLKTFFIWSFVGYIFFLFLGWLNDSFTLRGATYSIIRRLLLRGNIPINGPLWFLLTLFGVRMIANVLLPKQGGVFAILRIIGVILLGYMISYLAYRFNHRLLPYWVANGAAGMSFFALGYATRDCERKWWLVLPCVLVYVVGCIWGFPIVEMWSNTLLSGNYLLYFPVASCCILTFNGSCRLLYRYISIKPIEWVGKNAMNIYVIHCLIYVTIRQIFKYLDINGSGFELLIITLFAYALIIPLYVGVKSNFYRKCSGDFK